MKNLIIIILLFLSVGAIAQPPATFYTTKEDVTFNPQSTHPINNNYVCFTEFHYKNDILTAKDCNDNLYKFIPITTWEYNIEKKYCTCIANEPSSGTNWSFIFYYEEVTLSMVTEDMSLIIIYY